MARAQGDEPRARAAFAAAREEVVKALASRPDSAGTLSLLGTIDSGLGRKAEALAEGQRACELLPIGKDAIDGSDLEINLAQIEAWTGERTAAIDRLAALQKVPNLLSYGQLKLSPVWDDLRGEPRFEALVAGLEPRGGLR